MVNGLAERLIPYLQYGTDFDWAVSMHFEELNHSRKRKLNMLMVSRSPE